MKIICHRRNTLEELQATPKVYGVEVDVRSDGGELIIHHDALNPGPLFKDWVAHYKHAGPLILNVKEDGLEATLMETMEASNIEDYFFLDQSFPSLVKWANRGEKRCAIRVSEFESVETALSLAGKIDWVWVDCFHAFNLTKKDAGRLQRAHFNLCLVSPELQGRDVALEIGPLETLLQERNIRPRAVCTKRADLWEKLHL